MLFISPPFGNYINLPDTTQIKGSFTLEPREGLLKQIIKTLRYSYTYNGWVNKIGLRNKGLDYAINNYNKKDIYFMGFHPYNPPNREEQEFLLDPTGDASDLPESKIQFSMMLIQKFSQLYEASDRLHRMGYYDEWPTDYYHEVVSSRQQQFEKLFKGG